MTLGDQQETFMEFLPRLIDKAYALGFRVRGGELQRTQAQAQANADSGAGIANSLHLVCLAIDLKLTKAGVYQTDSAVYAELGAFWKTLHPLFRWGGDFKGPGGVPKPDGNHFSMEYQGRK